MSFVGLSLAAGPSTQPTSAPATAPAGWIEIEKYNALKLDRDRLAEQLSAAQNEAAVAKLEAELYRKVIDQKNNGAAPAPAR